MKHGCFYFHQTVTVDKCADFTVYFPVRLNVHMQRQQGCSRYASIAMLLQLCHMSLQFVVKLVEVLSRQVDGSSSSSQASQMSGDDQKTGDVKVVRILSGFLSPDNLIMACLVPRLSVFELIRSIYYNIRDL